MAKIVPGHVRVTGASVNYDLCMGPSGGVTLMIAVILTKQMGSDKTSAIMLVLAAAMSLRLAFRIKESSRLTED
jgi:hypothetical protein